ncbi:hypothetical protein RLW55_16825 [Hyphomicrobium sp. B1]|uniref:hypothetical protein n=1 Tax=Hyphomicrobium sp. B1 TaxID=3075651 RepID=UPI003C2DE984
MSVEEEAEFASLFGVTRYAKAPATEARIKAERRAAMTDKQRSRGSRKGAARSEQMHFRCTPAFKAFSDAFARHLSGKADKRISTADMIEEAVYALAKQKGYRGASDAG